MRMCKVRTMLALVVVMVLVAPAAAGSAAAAARVKQPRATRGFKNTEMMTARGFGKRAQEQAFVREGLNNPDNFWDLLETSQDRNMADQFEEKIQENLPLEWFAEEMMHNGDLTRSVVRKFIDLNQDGILSSDELLRNVY